MTDDTDQAAPGGDNLVEPRTPDGWTVQFDIPFTLSVPDSLDDPRLRSWAESVDDGEEPDPVPYSPRLRQGAMTIGTTSPVHLPDPDNLADPFEVPIRDGEVRLQFLRRMRNVDRTMLIPGELRPDRGIASFTTVKAFLSITLSRTLGRDDLSGVANTALEALNRFLEQYRYSAGAYWAQPITHAHVAEFEIFRHYADGRFMRPATYSSPPGGPVVIGSFLVDQDRDREIRTRLAAGATSPFSYEVVLSAKEHLHRGRLRNAVVDAATAFEISVADLIRSRLSDSEWSEDDIRDVFLRDGGPQYLGIRELVSDVLGDIVGIPFAGRAEYRDAVSVAIKVRNDVVHAGLRPTAAVAGSAIAAVEAAQSALADLAS